MRCWGAANGRYGLGGTRRDESALNYSGAARASFFPYEQDFPLATSLLALLDDIATVLDDVSVMTKVAAKKTAGVLGDDLALNAQQVSGVKADRELPVSGRSAGVR
ncbi:hypothetical protein SSTU70S_06269 [Stutzerimonas stutzeri]